MLGAVKLNSLAKYIPVSVGGITSLWEQYTSSTFTVGNNAVGYNSMCLHGIVNTNQLVGSMIYVESSGGGSGVLNKLRGFVLDLSTGAINIGSAVSLPAVGTYAGSTYKGAISGNAQYGLVAYIAGGDSYYSQVNGFTISNYSSCNQSTAPTFSLYSTPHNFYTSGNTLGDALQVQFVSGTRYVVTSRGNDQSVRGSYTWNGTTFSLEGTTNRAGISGSSYGQAAAFANPGNSLTYGYHLFGTDPNNNLAYVNQKSSNTVDYALQFYPSSYGGVVINGIKIFDQANKCRSLAIGRNATDTFLTAKIAKTTDFTSASGTVYGPADTTGLIGNTATFTLSSNGDGRAWLWYPISTTGLGVIEMSISGDSVKFDQTANTLISSGFNHSGVFTVKNYTSSNYGDWNVIFDAGGTNQGKITAFKCNNTRIAKMLEPTSTAQISTTQSKFGGSSLYVSGTSSKVQGYQDVSQSGDFTVECWAYLPGTGSYNGFVDLGSETTGRVALGVNAGKMYINIYGGADVFTGSGTVSTNTWNHLAWVRSGSTITAYLNGVSQGTYSNSGTFGNTGGFALMSYINNGSGGYGDEFRISKIARYTANFTPSTTPFVNDTDTVLLFHANGTNTSTFIDDDNGVRSPLGLIAVNQTQISTAQSKFGGSSIVFDGNDDYITVSGMPSLTGNYTFECWANFDILPWNQTLGGGSYMMLATGGSGDYLLITRNGTGSQVQIQVATGNKYGSFTKSGVNLAINTWYHIAVVRNGGVFKVFFNGTDLTTFTNDSGFTNSGRTENMAFGTIGRFIDSRGSMDGYMDEIRVSNSARYTGDFTPSTTAFVNDNNTILLIHGNGANTSTYLKDDNQRTNSNLS